MSVNVANLYLVGAPKCATTSLHHYLGNHPEIHAPHFKEPHYHAVVATGLPKWGVRDRAAYEALFADGQQLRYRLDSSAWNLYVEQAASLIRGENPDARIIMVLRHPVRRAYSHFLHMAQRGWERYHTFEEAIAHEEERIAQKAFWDYHYLAAGCYAKQLQRYLELFPEAQRRVYIYEDWVGCTDAWVKDIVKFLDLDPTIALPTGERKNVTKTNQKSMLRMMLARYGKGLTPIQRLLPRKLKDGVLTAAERLALFKKTPALSPETYAQLSKKMEPEITALEELLGRRIDAWHRP